MGRPKVQWMFRSPSGVVLSARSSRDAVLKAWIQAMTATPGYRLKAAAIPPVKVLQRRIRTIGLHETGAALVELGVITSATAVPSRDTFMRDALTRGPLAVSMHFHAAMLVPDYRGNIEPGDSKRLRFREAFTVMGFDIKRKAFRILNTRGPSWGGLGRAWITYDTWEQLADDQGRDQIEVAEFTL